MGRLLRLFLHKLSRKEIEENYPNGFTAELNIMVLYNFISIILLLMYMLLVVLDIQTPAGLYFSGSVDGLLV